jgi:hypothetical protein
LSTRLQAYQTEMLHQVYGLQVPEDPELALYREMTAFSMAETLDAVFPLTRVVFEKKCIILGSGPDWQEVGQAFFQQNPPTDFRVNWAVEKFPEYLIKFLQNFPEWPDFQWLPEVADFEWARFQVNTSRDGDEGDWLNPSLLLRQYRYAIPQWYSGFSLRNSTLHPLGNSAPEEAPSALALFRDPVSFKFRVLELQPAALDLMIQWQNGATPRSVATFIGGQLNRSPEEVLAQMTPLIQKLTQECIILTCSPG